MTGVVFLGDSVVSGSRDGTVRLWRLDGTPLWTLSLPGPVRRIALSPDGTQLAVAVQGERAVRLWRLDRLVRRLEGLGLSLPAGVVVAPQ